MSRIAINPAVIDSTIAGIRDDLRALLHPMSDTQEKFYDHMVGKGDMPESITLVEQYQVASSFLYAADGFPVVHTFDSARFPAFQIARSVCRERARLTQRYNPKQKGRTARRTLPRVS